MPNPQLENGFIQIATEIWEKLGCYRLSGEEWLVLNCVLRKTYGWHKKDDHISFTQFEKYTGLKRASVYRAVKKLYAKKLIGISKSANSQVNLYCFNKLISQWQPISKRAYTSKGISKKANRVSTKKLTEVLAKRRNTIYKKDTITKDILPIKKYSSLKDISEADILQIATEYKVSVGFVRLQLEKVRNYCSSKGKVYKNYKSALRNFVLGDMQRNIERSAYDNKRGIDASNL